MRSAQEYAKITREALRVKKEEEDARAERELLKADAAIYAAANAGQFYLEHSGDLSKIAIEALRSAGFSAVPSAQEIGTRGKLWNIYWACE